VEKGTASNTIRVFVVEWVLKQRKIKIRKSVRETTTASRCFRQTGQITKEEYDELDELHYKVENELIKLIDSLLKKQLEGGWQETFIVK
jgi:ribosome recycling factor